MKKSVAGCLLFLLLTPSAFATHWFIYPDPPLGGGHKYVNRQAADLVQKEGCAVQGNITKRISSYQAAGLGESEAIEQEQEVDAKYNLPPTLSPAILKALRKVYVLGEFEGMSPDQVKRTVTTSCIADHPLPGQARKKNKFQSPSPLHPEAASPPAPVASPPSLRHYQEGGANGSL